MYLEDPWPTMPDGTDFDGKHLLSLVRAGKSPFKSAWDVNQLIQELEGNLGATVTDMPFVYRGPNNYAHLLAQSARVRASLFSFQLPLDFAAAWFHERLFEQKPESLPVPVAPTREFCVALFTAKVEATIRNLGDMIGWESDEVTVGPVALAAKQSLLRFIPHMTPADDSEASLYRLVLEHGDFGIHNMSITTDADGQPLVTSLYDWETGCIVPALLSDPLMAVEIDLVADENAGPSLTWVPSYTKPITHVQYMEYSKHYFEAIYSHAPDCKCAIQAGKDAHHLWFALRDWRGADPESYIGDLGSWAELRMKELGIA